VLFSLRPLSSGSSRLEGGWNASQKAAKTAHVFCGARFSVLSATSVADSEGNPEPAEQNAIDPLQSSVLALLEALWSVQHRRLKPPTAR
jgi:hypothetical protein